MLAINTGNYSNRPVEGYRSLPATDNRPEVCCAAYKPFVVRAFKRFKSMASKVRRPLSEMKTASLRGEAVAWDFYGGYLTSLSKEATCGRGKV
ncbi:hypothetical protein EMIT047CA2_20387 [Pseudomonas soli]